MKEEAAHNNVNYNLSIHIIHVYRISKGGSRYLNRDVEVYFPLSSVCGIAFTISYFLACILYQTLLQLYNQVTLKCLLFPKQKTQYNTELQKHYTILIFYFQCQCSCVLIKSSHADYMATDVYRTLMSGRFNPISVEYFDRKSLCNSRTSISCIGIMNTGLLNDFLYNAGVKKTRLCKSN